LHGRGRIPVVNETVGKRIFFPTVFLFIRSKQFIEWGEFTIGAIFVQDGKSDFLELAVKLLFLKNFFE
jgi:hypothetical protein